jgi:DNA-binding NarL/FixJ family response regulator
VNNPRRESRERDSVEDVRWCEDAGEGLASFAAVREMDEEATRAEAHAAELRAAADCEKQRVNGLAKAMFTAIRAEDLVKLSPRQLEIVRLHVVLAAVGEQPSHHAVAERLGVRAATVSKQWGRIAAKLAQVDAQVSTPAA